MSAISVGVMPDVYPRRSRAGTQRRLNSHASLVPRYRLAVIVRFCRWRRQRQAARAALGAAHIGLELDLRWTLEGRHFEASAVCPRLSVVVRFCRPASSTETWSTRQPILCADRRCRTPPLGLTLQYEALLTAARQSHNRVTCARVCLLGLLELRIFETVGPDIDDLGEEDGHRVLRLRGKGGSSS